MHNLVKLVFTLGSGKNSDERLLLGETALQRVLC